LREIHRAVPCGFGTDQGTAPAERLTRQHAGELVAQTLVLAEKIADFAAAHADIPGGNVRVRADMARQLRHEGLAETHHFIVALAFRVEIGAALAAAHG